jgi:arylsulfatase A-like enzyme
VVYFLVDNLGMGELSSYSGGPLRGVTTARIDAFAKEGMKLVNFAPEAQCTPSRSALMTGRYSIRSGNHTVALAGSQGGLVKWERTMGDIFSDAGYATAIVGKWHIGDSAGRWPMITDSTSGMGSRGRMTNAFGRRILGMTPSATRSRTYSKAARESQSVSLNN